MNRREAEKEKNEKLASIEIGFGNNFSLQSGLVVGSSDMTVGVDQGAKGLVIPWMGCKHIRICMGED